MIATMTELAGIELGPFESSDIKLTWSERGFTTLDKKQEFFPSFEATISLVENLGYQRWDGCRIEGRVYKTYDGKLTSGLGNSWDKILDHTELSTRFQSVDLQFKLTKDIILKEDILQEGTTLGVSLDRGSFPRWLKFFSKHPSTISIAVHCSIIERTYNDHVWGNLQIKEQEIS